ncbi:O-antigen ligase family protein [Sporosalibacterium faouarense]|uniref:O-antigen ligase family protein n=1 Tax=Sporosalibacterium faouarense TaxID=516123 RepID=UPI00192C65FC|nr:O-antigen ligase family protein [Sporosalibacterium faouarense]
MKEWISPIYSIIFFIIGLPYLSDMQLLLVSIGVVGIYLIYYIIDGDFKFNYTPANIFLLIFGILVFLNTVLSIDPNGSFRDFSLHMASLGMIFVFTNSRKTKQDMYLINVVLVLVALTVSIYGISQYVNGVEMGSGWVDPTQNPDLTTRVFATFENPNLLAEYLIMIFPVGLALIFYNKSIFKRLFFSAATFIILITIGLTYSRGGWLGLMVGIIVFLFLVNRKALLALIPVGMVGVLFLPASIIHRVMTLGSFQDTSIIYRLNLLSKSVNIVKDFWYSGIGLGYIPFQQIIPLYIRTMAPYHTHNLYLQIAIEMGVVGIIVFLLLIFSLMKMSIKLSFNSESRFIGIFTAAYAASLSGILVHGIAEHIFFNPKIIMAFWLIVGILINYYVLNSNEEKKLKLEV